jgi:predicted ABC-type ATPase
MFAGPNGSGKSTLFTKLPPELVGIYLNPDEIEQFIRKTGVLDPKTYGVNAAPEDILQFLRESPFLRSVGLESKIARLIVRDGTLGFEHVAANGYLASVISDFLRHRLLQTRQSFTFETVMSSPDKVDFLAKAQKAGCRTYLYYIATEDPIINQSRVEARVNRGGHPVPEDKIASRYHRSLGLLPGAIRNSNRAYIFDNSGDKVVHTWLAEITDGKTLVMKSEQIPSWFKRAVLDRMA